MARPAGDSWKRVEETGYLSKADASGGFFFPYYIPTSFILKVLIVDIGVFGGSNLSLFC
jgi:hypothetical protein